MRGDFTSSRPRFFGNAELNGIYIFCEQMLTTKGRNARKPSGLMVNNIGLRNRVVVAPSAIEAWSQRRE